MCSFTCMVFLTCMRIYGDDDRHLRRVRLDHAHQDLKRASPGDGLTVTAVAYRWGFRSSSRFAAAYREAYGVSPSHTLRPG